MAMAESEEEAAMAGRFSDHRKTVRRRGPGAEPRFVLDRRAEGERAPRFAHRRVDLRRVGARAQRRKLDARGDTHALAHRREHMVAAAVVDGAGARWPFAGR